MGWESSKRALKGQLPREAGVTEVDGANIGFKQELKAKVENN